MHIYLLALHRSLVAGAWAGCRAGRRAAAILILVMTFPAPAATVSIPDTAVRLHKTLEVGTPVYLESKSPRHAFSVVFEEDGSVAYFYALDAKAQGSVILDQLHIYDVGNVRTEHRVSDLKIVWSRDGAKAMLLLNDFAHAVFDFKGRRGYCRNNYPPPNRSWTAHGHEWNDDVVKLFR